MNYFIFTSPTTVQVVKEWPEKPQSLDLYAGDTAIKYFQRREEYENQCKSILSTAPHLREEDVERVSLLIYYSPPLSLKVFNKFEPQLMHPYQLDVEVERIWDEPCGNHECRETAGFKGTEHEGTDVCEDGCLWSKPTKFVKLIDKIVDNYLLEDAKRETKRWKAIIDETHIYTPSDDAQESEPVKESQEELWCEVFLERSWRELVDYDSGVKLFVEKMQSKFNISRINK